MTTETRNPQQAILNSRPATRIPQLETRNTQPATRNSQHATRITRHSSNFISSDQSEIRNPKSAIGKPVFLLELGLINYQDAWTLQQQLVAARLEKQIDRDMLLFLEHPPVFTLGRRGGLENLLVSEAFLEDRGVPVVQIERGGFITYHAPGQAVVYPIINLHARRLGVRDFVSAMEEVMIQTAGNWGIAAERNALNSGVWVGSNKLGSIGIALRKGVSFHGLALNVNLDLTPFSWVQPCGLEGVAMTSMQNEIGRDLKMSEVFSALKDQFVTALGFSMEDCRLAEIKDYLNL